MVERFYGPCGACRAQLAGGATIARPEPVAAVEDDVVPLGVPVPGGRRTRAQGPAPVVTKRRWRPMPARRVAWLEWETGEGCDVDGRTWQLAPRCELPVLLDSLHAVEQLHVVGLVAPAVVRAWALAAPPRGWKSRPAYLDDTAPIASWTHLGDGRTVRVSCASAWLGRGDYTAAQAAAGWRLAEELIGAEFHGARLVGTPATTGRELIVRTLPEGVELPVLAPELQELIRSTSGQGRSELWAPAGREVPSLVELDMRLAYAAVAWGMPTGSPTLYDDDPGHYDPQQRGRYLVDWTVPDGWDRPGILPAMRERGGWHYPSRAHETASGWVDGAELALARGNGWDCTVRSALLWPLAQPHDPLKRWAAKISAASLEADRLGRTGRTEVHVAGCARWALRAVVLFTIGALQGRRHDVTHSCSIDQPGEVPADAIGSGFVGDRIVWRERQGAAWPEMAHPEWSASIWAKARVRLLDAPSGQRGVRHGALWLDPANVIGFRTDALYVVTDPGWADDGKPGRYRAKGHHGPLTIPTTMEQLDHLRGAGATPTHGIAAARQALRAGIAGPHAPLDTIDRHKQGAA